MSDRYRVVARFLAAGAFAAGVNFGTRFAYSAVVAFPLAVGLAYLTGMVVAFYLMRGFVFGAGTQSTGQSAAMFFAVNMVGIAEVVTISVVLEKWVLASVGVEAHREALAHAIAIPSVAVSSFWGHKHFSFRSHRMDHPLR